MSDKLEITPELLDELSAAIDEFYAASDALAATPNRGDQHIHAQDRRDRARRVYAVAASPAAVRALVREVERLRGDEAQLVALVARATVEDADTPLPATSPDPCRPTKLQAAIADVRHRLCPDRVRHDDALLSIIAAAERVPALVAEAERLRGELAQRTRSNTLAGQCEARIERRQKGATSYP